MGKVAVKKQNDMAKLGDYAKITDFPRKTENPFADDLVKEMTVKQKRRYLNSDNKMSAMVVQSETGEQLAEATFYEIEEVDDSQFVKIFANFFSTQHGLSKSGREVLNYIMTEIEARRDTVQIRAEKAMSFLGYATHKPLYRGLADLLNNDVIARTKWTDEYFINPLIMFNGDRVAYAKMYVRKKTKQVRERDPNQIDMFDAFEHQRNPSMKTVKRQHDRITETPDNEENQEPVTVEIKNLQ
jgi:hypothetical protein